MYAAMWLENSSVTQDLDVERVEIFNTRYAYTSHKTICRFAHKWLILTPESR